VSGVVGISKPSSTNMYLLCLVCCLQGNVQTVVLHQARARLGYSSFSCPVLCMQDLHGNAWQCTAVTVALVPDDQLLACKF
jgi:hypothetical protein